MRRVNALELRQSLGKVVRRLEKDGAPILLERGRRPVAVLISLRDFEERFVERAAAEARDALLAEIDSLVRDAADPTAAEDILRELRGP
jgi:prevent-host-death family protein